MNYLIFLTGVYCKKFDSWFEEDYLKIKQTLRTTHHNFNIPY